MVSGICMWGHPHTYRYLSCTMCSSLFRLLLKNQVTAWQSAGGLELWPERHNIYVSYFRNECYRCNWDLVGHCNLHLWPTDVIPMENAKTTKPCYVQTRNNLPTSLEAMELPIWKLEFLGELYQVLHTQVNARNFQYDSKFGKCVSWEWQGHSKSHILPWERGTVAQHIWAGPNGEALHMGKCG